jgi:hypothetical protein
MSGDRVSFLIAGVQKGGTTALFEYLRRDLPVSLPRVKETHFFDDESSVDWRAPDYAAYHAGFDPPDGRPRGEATPIYIYWPDSLERIAAYNPAMRLILSFRDPVERAWSHWRMETARGFDDAPFSWAIREGRRRVRESGEKPGHHRVFSYVERGFYGAQLQRALTLFPREQILCLASEQLKRDPAAVLHQVCCFLQLPGPAKPIRPLAANVGQGRGLPSAEDALYLRDLYAEDAKRFAALSGLDLSPVADEPGLQEGGAWRA